MPRKINLPPVVERVNMPSLSQAPAKSSEPVVAPVIKKKREITEAQREHLNKIRTLAMAKKAELKEITLKSKLAKTVSKKDLAEQYDNYVAQKAVQSVKPKPAPERLLSQAHASEPEPEESEEEIIVKKPKKKIKKKIIFESESDDETIVVQKKKQPLEKLVYESNKDQLYQRMIEERVKNAVIGYGRALHGY